MKKILALLAVLLVAVMIFACGSKTTTTAPATTEPTVATPAPTDGTTAKPIQSTTKPAETTNPTETTKPAETTTKPAEVTTTKPVEVTTTKPVEVTTTKPVEVKPAVDVIFEENGYDLSNYVKVDLGEVLHAYYNSTSKYELTKGDATSKSFFATGYLNKAQIPAGAVIVVADGYKYRPEGWQTAGSKNTGTRPDNVTTSLVVVDDAWWGNFTVRGFNVTGGAELTAVPEGVFAIYVPKVPSNGLYVDVDFANGTVTDKNGYASFQNVGTPVVETVRVKYNGVYKEVEALRIKEAGSFVVGTFKNLDTEALMQEMLNKGFTIEVFYLDNSTGNAGVFCMTENPSGFGIAHTNANNANKGKPYFITGNGGTSNVWNAAYGSVASDDELVHVVGVYDAVAKTHSIYVNGVDVSDRTVYPGTDVPGVDAIAGNLVSKEGIALFNAFCMGGDLAQYPTYDRVDFPANDLTIVDAKFYVGALTADEAKAAFDAATKDFGLVKGQVYVDVDFNADGTITDKNGYASFQNVGTPVVADTKVKFNGVELTVPALQVNAKGNFVVATFTELLTVDAMNDFLASGFSIEAFYLDNSSVAAGIVCMTENPSGWGLAHNTSNIPYFITGNGTSTPWNAAYSLVSASNEELVHVVATYDPDAALHTIYVNGVEVSKRDTKNQPGTNVPGVVAADITGGQNGIKAFNTFCMGADISAKTNTVADFTADNLVIVDAKIYYGALTAAQVATAYTNATKDFVKAPVADETITTTATESFIGFVPAANTTVALNASTGVLAGNVTAGEGVTVKGGYLYVVEVVDGKLVATSEVGSAIVNSGMAVGTNNTRSPDNPKNPGKVNGGSWWKTVGKRSFTVNCLMDAAKLNEALGETTDLGTFGKLTFTVIEEDMIYFDTLTTEENDIVDFNWKFVYFDYEGNELKEATGTEYTPLALNQMAIIRHAMEVAMGLEQNYIDFAWQKYVDNYGAPGSTTTCDIEGCGCGKSLQDHWQNAFLNNQLVDKYTSAYNAYAKLVFDENTYKTILDAKDAALAAATAALEAAADKSDEEKAALQAIVDLATAEQKTAATNYGRFATYADWSAKYAAFVEEYNKAANFVLFTAEQLEEEEYTESVLYKMFKDAAEDAAKPSFTYIYDADSNTITVYVTSAKDSTVRTSW